MQLLTIKLLHTAVWAFFAQPMTFNSGTTDA